MLVALKRLLDDARHLELRGAKFISGMPGFQQATGAEDAIDGEFVRFFRSSFFRHEGVLRYAKIQKLT